MAIWKVGKHTLYSGPDCAPGHVLVGDAMVPKCEVPDCPNWVMMGEKRCPKHMKKEAAVAERLCG